MGRLNDLRDAQKTSYLTMPVHEFLSELRSLNAPDDCIADVVEEFSRDRWEWVSSYFREKRDNALEDEAAMNKALRNREEEKYNEDKETKTKAASKKSRKRDRKRDKKRAKNVLS